MTNPDQQIWDAVLSHLKDDHPDVCRQWFAELEPLGIGSATLTIRAHTALHRDYLRRGCLDAFNDSVRTVTGKLIGIRFLGPDEPWGSVKSKPHHVVEPKQLISHVATERENIARAGELAINPDNDFEHFVIGPNNRLAQAAAVSVSESPGQTYNPLFIHGDVGLGKTHLLQAICLRIATRDPSTVIHYVSCDGFMTSFMNAVQSGKMDDFRHQYRDVDVLVIDDIHCLAKRDRTQEEFFHTFNALYQANKQIILSSDAPPEEIPDLESRLVSRFQSGLVAQMDPPGYETRVQIVKSKASIRGLDIPDDVANLIAQRMSSNIREIEGAITSIQLHSTMDGKPICLELAQTALGSDRPRPTHEPSIDGIISVVSEFYGVKRTEVLGKRRHKSISLPRQVSMFLARRHTRHSLEEIGAHFGGRDHTTVMHAVRTVDHKRIDDNEFSAVVELLDSRLGRHISSR